MRGENEISCHEEGGMKAIPPLKSLVIVAGPSGAGKTTLSDRLIAGMVPGFDFPLPQPAMRTDARSLRRKDIPGGSLIVEFATGRLADAEARAKCLDEINRLIDRAEQTLVLTYAISKGDLIRQYVGRLSEERLRRTPELFRYLRFGKIRRVLGYMLSGEIEQGHRGWGEIVSALEGRPGLRFGTVTSPFGENGRYEFSGP
jgi:hypothetical protein